ncbi:DivIVA domain-containing protein [Marisediminicola senii]|uniref:DivIVA domain-containing protein n=1 Tax=Marisediminicola senii TaxID=2711233 RepID=UPI0013EC786F|nr:DivIVA domain-containing protein [Marisediminicola senii]
MSTTFPRTRRPRLGYRVEQVEDFLEEARRAYDAGAVGDGVITSQTIRHTAFELIKGGYETDTVDAALERLEDAFALRERERALKQRGDDAYYADARVRAQEILDRLARPAGERFTRAGRLTAGYHVGDVDAFADLLVAYFRDGVPLTITEVRTAAFRSRRGGYSEPQVDLVIDAVIDVMLAVR